METATRPNYWKIHIVALNAHVQVRFNSISVGSPRFWRNVTGFDLNKTQKTFGSLSADSICSIAKWNKSNQREFTEMEVFPVLLEFLNLCQYKFNNEQIIWLLFNRIELTISQNSTRSLVILCFIFNNKYGQSLKYYHISRFSCGNPYWSFHVQ